MAASSPFPSRSTFALSAADWRALPSSRPFRSDGECKRPDVGRQIGFNERGEAALELRGNAVAGFRAQREIRGRGSR